MFKYFMIIDGENYNALFETHVDASDFISEVREEDGSVIDVIDVNEVSAKQVLEDADFEHAYKIEMLAKMLLVNPNQYTKWTDMQHELVALGYPV